MCYYVACRDAHGPVRRRIVGRVCCRSVVHPARRTITEVRYGLLSVVRGVSVLLLMLTLTLMLMLSSLLAVADSVIVVVFGCHWLLPCYAMLLYAIFHSCTLCSTSTSTALTIVHYKIVRQVVRRGIQAAGFLDPSSASPHLGAHRVEKWRWEGGVPRWGNWNPMGTKYRRTSFFQSTPRQDLPPYRRTIDGFCLPHSNQFHTYLTLAKGIAKVRYRRQSMSDEVPLGSNYSPIGLRLEMGTRIFSSHYSPSLVGRRVILVREEGRVARDL